MLTFTHARSQVLQRGCRWGEAKGCPLQCLEQTACLSHSWTLWQRQSQQGLCRPKIHIILYSINLVFYNIYLYDWANLCWLYSWWSYILWCKTIRNRIHLNLLDVVGRQHDNWRRKSQPGLRIPKINIILYSINMGYNNILWLGYFVLLISLAVVHIIMWNYSKYIEYV